MEEDENLDVKSAHQYDGNFEQVNKNLGQDHRNVEEDHKLGSVNQTHSEPEDDSDESTFGLVDLFTESSINLGDHEVDPELKIVVPTAPVKTAEPSPVIEIEANPEINLRRSVRLQIKRQEEEERKAEEARKKAEAAAVAKKLEAERQRKPFEPLTDAQMKTVSSVMNVGFGIFKPHDLTRVVPTGRGGGTEGWLNDEVINAYLTLIAEHGNQGLKPEKRKYHAFNSFFYKNIIDKGYDSVSRWSRRAKLEPKIIMAMEAIYVPVNAGNHWTLLVMRPSARKVEYYDSMNGNGGRAITAAKAWLAGELKALYKESEWKFEPSTPSPQQNNFSDCGVFTVTTAKMLTLNIDPLVYGPSDIPMQRRRIIAELKEGHIF